MKKRELWASALSMGLLAAAGCGGGGGGGASPGPTPTNVPSGTVSGVAAKGLLLDAIVNFYPVANGVADSAAVVSVRTDAKTGAFSSIVTAAGPVVVIVTTDSSTQMLDEISGTAIAAPSGLTLHAVFDSVTNLQPIAVTPLTEMAYNIAKSSTGALTTTNIDAANNAVSTSFLAGVPVLYTQPIDIKTYASATAAQQEQAKLLAAFAVAANEGIATGASGAPCATNYSANIVCLIGGLGNLLSVNSSGAITLGSAGTYLSAAYASIDSGTVTIGGQTPGALGLNVATAAETSFVTAIGKQAPLPGYDAGANPLANTKALFANIRTNIIDQASTQTFGYAPTLQALSADYEANVHPVAADTVALLSAAHNAVDLIQLGTTTTAAQGAPSANISNPSAIASDGLGNIYVVNGNNTISKVSGTTASLFAGQPGVMGSSDGPATQATFTNIAAIAVDSSGNVYVSDNSTIREITAAGAVTTVAGQSGVVGSTNGIGGSATFYFPFGIAVDSSGNLYVAEPNNQDIRKITPAGVVSTLAGQVGVSGSADGNAEAATFACPAGIAVDGGGNVYVTDFCNSNVRKVTSAGVVSTIAGDTGVYGYADGVGAAAIFNYLNGIAVDGNDNLYIADTNNSAVRMITPAGVVSTLARTTAGQRSNHGDSLGGGISGIALDASDNVYVADDSYNSVQEITSGGVISTLIHGLVNYQGGCGYDPVGLVTANNAALCRYGLANNQILLTVTQAGTGAYTLQTEALSPTTEPNACVPFYSPLCGYTVVSSIAPLQSTFTWTVGATGAESGTFSGPYYVNASGGQVQGSLSAAESSDWNSLTGTGSITVGGSLSGGAGGVSLVSATIGSDSVITIQNGSRLLTSPATPIIAAGLPAVTITGAMDLTEWSTSGFSYAVKATIGAPIEDKSTALALPGTVSVTGSIAQKSGNGTTPLFSGTVSASLQGLPSFNALQPISATNFFTADATFDGTLSLPGGRVLTVTATANASPITPTPTQPDSVSATYSYTTPTGTATLNATGKYDATNGYSGTITNNAGVVIAVTDPIGGTVTGTVMANGTETATIKGAFIYYSDGTSESLF